jgi:glycosyltransferase involved in cell wall biosynthesis
MHILRIIYDWPPPWFGLSPHPYELTSSQINMGHTFEIFCGHWPKAGPRQKLPNVKFHSFIREPFPGTLTLTTSVLMFFHYLRWRYDTKNYVDLIHSHGHFGIWVYLYRSILKRFFPKSDELSIPLVVHFHNVAQGRWENAKEKNTELKTHTKYISWPMEKWANQLAVKTASACIFVSEDNRQEAIKYYGADPEKCFVVESGVNTDIFTPVGQEEREKSRRDLALDKIDKVILNFGVMLERKNIHLLVEMMKYLPQPYKLLLVGPGDIEYLGRLDEMIKKANLKDRVVRADYTPYPSAPIAYQVADIFVLPSSWEGFPKVVVESLATGIPTLVSGFKAKDEVQGLFYFNSLEPEQMAAQLQDILNSHPQVDRYFIEKTYSWKLKAQEVEVIYKKVFGYN